MAEKHTTISLWGGCKVRCHSGGVEGCGKERNANLKRESGRLRRRKAPTSRKRREKWRTRRTIVGGSDAERGECGPGVRREGCEQHYAVAVAPDSGRNDRDLDGALRGAEAPLFHGAAWDRVGMLIKNQLQGQRQRTGVSVLHGRRCAPLTGESAVAT